MSHIITVENLVKKYKKADKNAVDGISLSVKAGEFFAFLGPNGAGKTTTISILTTTLSKTSGSIKIAGYDLDTHPSEVRKNIGVIFQNPSLDLNLTAEENIRFHTVLYGMYEFKPFYSMMPKAYKDTVTELAKVLGIEKELFKPLKTFSGGMKRKLEIIRTITHHPKVLFLDEPTSGLDPLSRKNLWDYIHELKNREKTTIFLTTHYLDEAEGADRVCIVNEGKIIDEGTPKEVKDRLLDEYLLVKPENLEQLKKELDAKHINYLAEDHTLKISVKNLDAWQLIKSIDEKVIDFKFIKPTLEEAYLSIVGNHDRT